MRMPGLMRGAGGGLIILWQRVRDQEPKEEPEKFPRIIHVPVSSGPMGGGGVQGVNCT